jgi:hypothetical protein
MMLDKRKPYLLVLIVGKGLHTKITKEKTVRKAVFELCKELYLPNPIQSLVNEGVVFVSNTSYIPLTKSFEIS